MQWATEWLGQLGFSPANLTDRLRDAATNIASQSASFAAAGFSATASTLLGSFFTLLAMHVTLLHWSLAVGKLEALLPLRPEHTRALLAAFRRAGRATLLGTVVTGLVQGALAAIGYWATGVPEPAFFGIATAIASIVPAVGTLLVWVPAGVYLLLSGHVAWGVVELAWGLLVVVGFSDYVIRPRLVGDEDMPLILTFIAMFGARGPRRGRPARRPGSRIGRGRRAASLRPRDARDARGCCALSPGAPAARAPDQRGCAGV